MIFDTIANGLNWYAVEYVRQYDLLRCIVCDKVIDDPQGMYSWPITHGHPSYAVTVVFSCPEHTIEERDRSAEINFGWMLTPGLTPIK